MPATTPAGFAVGVLVLVGFIFCTLSTEWKRSSSLDTADHLNKTSEGLWLRCTLPDVGEIHCDSFDSSIIGLPSEDNTYMWVLMILACTAGFTGLAMGMMALDCVHAVKGNKKNLLAGVGGMLMVFGSVLCFAAVSWYAHITRREYHIATSIAKYSGNTQLVYKIGSAIYVGWVAGIFGVIAGILVACGLDFRDNDSRDYRYGYQPSHWKKSSPAYA